MGRSVKKEWRDGKGAKNEWKKWVKNGWNMSKKKWMKCNEKLDDRRKKKGTKKEPRHVKRTKEYQNERITLVSSSTEFIPAKRIFCEYDNSTISIWKGIAQENTRGYRMKNKWKWNEKRMKNKKISLKKEENKIKKKVTVHRHYPLKKYPAKWKNSKKENNEKRDAKITSEVEWGENKIKTPNNRRKRRDKY